jgi:methyl-accepting chemotaxis protein
MPAKERKLGMKIAEALALRSDLQKRLEQLKQRLVRNARIQEGDAPAEDPIGLETELEEVAKQLTSMIQRINRTNAATQLVPQTLADALAERDVLKMRQNAYRELANAASTAQGRTTRSEIKFISTVSVAAIQRKADDLARAYRELDTRIQEADWLTVLQE